MLTKMNAVGLLKSVGRGILSPFEKKVAVSFILSLIFFTLTVFLPDSAAVTIPATPTNTSPGYTTSPGPTTSSSTVSLSWSSSSGATYYGLGVRDIATGTLVVDTNVTSTSYSAILTAGKQYKWNVAACNSVGCSSYSTVLYFQTPGIPPTVTTNPASSITSNSATLNGTVNPNGLSTIVMFIWGTTTSYEKGGTSIVDAGSGTTTTSWYAELTGLSPSTTYNYKFWAYNSAGDAYGANQTFTTDYKLTTSVSGSGSVSPSCSGGCWYSSGSYVTITATAEV